MTGLINSQTHKLTALFSGLLLVSLLCPFLDAETTSQWDMGKPAQLLDRSYGAMTEAGTSCMGVARKGYKLGKEAAILIYQDVSDIRNIGHAELKKAAVEAFNRVGTTLVMLTDKGIEIAIRDNSNNHQEEPEWFKKTIAFLSEITTGEALANSK